MKEFTFGQWVLIDGVVEGQYIHPLKDDMHTIDVNGMWLDIHTKQLSIK